jgi:hypothetical protein
MYRTCWCFEKEHLWQLQKERRASEAKFTSIDQTVTEADVRLRDVYFELIL